MSSIRVLWQMDVSVTNVLGELNLFSGSGSSTVDGDFTDAVLEVFLLDWCLGQLDERPAPADVELVRFVWLPEP